MPITARSGPELEEFARAFRAQHEGEPLGPIASRVVHEDDHVRVWELVLEPGEASALHHHDAPYAIVLVAGDRVAAVPGPGSTRGAREALVTPGRTVALAPGDTEWAVNTGTLPYRELLIELKTR